MLGDSITASTCYPQLLLKQLKDGGIKNFTFVGGVTNNKGSSECGTTVETMKTEGHGGYFVTYLNPANTRACTKAAPGCGTPSELATWIAGSSPDIVLFHMGTNDVWEGIATSTILTAYQYVMGQFRAKNPNIVFFVSRIIKLNPSGCTGCTTNVTSLATALTNAWATTNTTANSPVYIVDHYASTFTPTTAYTSDGVHPNAAGAQIMANVTYDALVASSYF